MKKNAQKKKGGFMWVFLYVTVFVVVFIASALFKLTYNPLADKYKTDWNSSVGQVFTDISYGSGEANKFDLYVPADNTKESYGLIVYLHAGGFTSGDKSDDTDMLKWLCSKGYVTAGINYTLFSDANPSASVYSQSLDIQAAMPYVVAEAEKLGYPLDRMAISGGSAGGCLALIYAYRDAGTSPLPVKMVFEMVGPASFYREDWTNYGLDKSAEAAADLFSAMSGSLITPEQIENNEYLNTVRPISADCWVREGSAPALIAYGRYDKICPFLSAGRLIDAFEKYNVPYDYFEFSHSGHGLQNDGKQYAQYMDKLEDYLNRYMGEQE